MSGQPDLERIKQPEPSPPDEPDEKTKAEKQEFKQKRPNAAERETASHNAHLETWKLTAERHCGEYEKLRAETQIIRESLASSQQREKDLCVRCGQLEDNKRHFRLF